MDTMKGIIKAIGLKSEMEKQIAELRTETRMALRMVENKFDMRIQELDDNIKDKIKKALGEIVEEAIKKQPPIQTSRQIYSV